MRVLRAGPGTQPRCRSPPSAPRPPLGQRARRPDRRMHLVRPDIGARHRTAARRHIAPSTSPLVDQQALRRAGCRRKRLREVAETGHAGPGLPVDAQFAQAPAPACSSRSATTPTKSRITTTAAACRGCARSRTFVDRVQRVADELAMVGARIGRPHHAPVQHAGHAHVVHEHQLARELGRDADARLARADDAVVGRVLGAGARSRACSTRALARHELGEARCRGRPRSASARMPLRTPAAHRPPRRRRSAARRQQPGPRLRGRRRAAARGSGSTHSAMVAPWLGTLRGVAEHHAHAGQPRSSSSATIWAKPVPGCRCQGRRGR